MLYNSSEELSPRFNVSSEELSMMKIEYSLVELISYSSVELWLLIF